MDNEKLTLLGHFFPKTFTNNGALRLYAATRTDKTTLDLRIGNGSTQQTRTERLLPKIQKMEYGQDRRNADMTSVELEEIKAKNTMSGQKEGRQLTKEGKNASVYETWPTQTFYSRTEQKFFKKLRESAGSDQTRRYLGVYYELCVKYAFDTYFEGRNLTVPYVKELVLNDMAFKDPTDFGKVITSMATRFLRSWDRGLVSVDSGKLNKIFRLEYQREFSGGEGRNKFNDFVLRYKDRGKKYDIIGKLQGIGEVKWTYMYNTDLVAEMKSLSCGNNEIMSTANSQIRQASDRGPGFITSFLALLRIQSSGRKTRKDVSMVSEYGVFTALTQPPLTANNVYREVHLIGDNFVNNVRHLVNETPQLSFTINTNIWKLKTGNSVYSYTTGVLVPEINFFLPLKKANVKRICVYPTIIKFEDQTDEVPVGEVGEIRLTMYSIVMSRYTRNPIYYDSIVWIVLNFDADKQQFDCKLYQYEKESKTAVEFNGWPELVKLLTNADRTKLQRGMAEMEEGDDYEFFNETYTGFNSDKDYFSVFPMQTNVSGDKIVMNTLNSVPVDDGSLAWRSRDSVDATRVDDSAGAGTFFEMKDNLITMIPGENLSNLQMDQNLELKIQDGSRCLVVENCRQQDS